MAVIDLEDGHIYFLESDAGNNQNWIAGGATTIDLTNFTEGTEYCKLEMPQRWVKSFNTGMEIINSGAGNSFQLRYARRFYNLLSNGIKTSLTNGDLVEKFFTIDAHTESSSATYKDYYIVIRFSATSFVNFTDQAGSRKDFCKGAVISGSMTWDESSATTVAMRLNFNSIWN